MWEWLLASIDPLREHNVGFEVSWHARLMILSWAFLVPVGILIARFMKITPKQNWPDELDNRTWWYLHLGMQWTAFVLAILGLGLIVYKLGQISIFAHLHQTFGWLTLALMLVQVLAGMFRGSKGGPTYPAPDGSWRGDHYDMTRRRRVFEYFHKTLGYIALVSSIIAIMLGLWMANAPNWMWVVLSLWYMLLIFSGFFLQKKKGAIDTYQAIWGPDPKLPGNKLKPIGVGLYRKNGQGE